MPKKTNGSGTLEHDGTPVGGVDLDLPSARPLASSERSALGMTGPDWAPFVSTTELCDCLRLSRSCLYERMDELFPRLVKFGTRTAIWPLAVLEALVRNRMDVRAGMTHLRQPIELPHWTEWCPSEPLGELACSLADLQLLTVNEVAERLGVSVSTVYRFVRYRGLTGPLPVTERARRWLASEVTRWQNSCVAVSLRISGELPPRASRRRHRPSQDEDRSRS